MKKEVESFVIIILLTCLAIVLFALNVRDSYIVVATLVAGFALTHTGSD